ncbi:uncharacterized protein B0H18DRAFT_981966 [Fomitopsis serialis]|uniref:uncharacterized protein n=1 Tax=Fomitopsis serialis TaxID=139415 RepID=UPI0020076CF9|nr:uncharacterized protein B0H18DRAFT_981966 [Neoantrodia serialis]KAH9933779.1 hypothetical protein B0H18DRAFT_981966 [Neoantrodia serialis]
MQTSHFPPEIYEQWITRLRHDRAALKVCALACREWAPLSQRYLFEHVKVQGAPRWLRFLRTLETSASMGTDIGRYIHNFELVDIGIGYVVQKLFEDIALYAGHRHMPNVQQLSLRDWNWASMVDRAQDYDPISVPRRILKGLLPFEKLRGLELIDNFTRHPQIIPQLLTFFPFLSTVRIVGLRLSPDTPQMELMPLETDIQVTLPINIQELYFDRNSVQFPATYILDSITRPPFQLSLRTLDVGRPEIPESMGPDRMLRLAESAILALLGRATLRHLRITYLFLHLVDLSRLPQLQSITLHWDIPPPSPRNELVFDDIRQLFSSITGDLALQDVELRFSLVQSHLIVRGPLLLAGLDAALLRLHISCPAVTVHFHFSFYEFVSPRPRNSLPSIAPLLRDATRHAVAAGLHATVTSVTTFWSMPSNVEQETSTEETDLSARY